MLLKMSPVKKYAGNKQMKQQSKIFKHDYLEHFKVHAVPLKQQLQSL